MHGLSPDDELAYWREQAKHWQAKAEGLESLVDDLRHDIANERQVVADLREQWRR